MVLYTSCQELFKELFRLLEDADLVESISHDFSKLELSGKISYTYKLMQNHNMLPHLTKMKQKSKEKATKYKNEGNKAFVQRKDKEALLLYTKSISLSPYGSEELAVAFANRSAVLYSLKEYGKCIEDVDRALSGSYPKMLRYKLLDRKGKCFLVSGKSEEAKTCFSDALESLSGCNLLSDQHAHISKGLASNIASCNDKSTSTPSDKLIPSFSSVPELKSANYEIPSMGKCLRIEYSENMGRQVVTSENISPGEVLVVEKPYASILLPDYYLTHCYNCFVRCVTLVPCKRCTLAMFCTEACCTEAWNRSHSTECEILHHVLSLEFGKMDLLALRILLIATKQGQYLTELQDDISKYKYTDNCKKGFNFSNRYVSTDYCTVHSLEGNIDRRSVADIFRRCAGCVLMLHLLKTQTSFFTSIRLVGEMVDFDKTSLASSDLTDDEIFVGSLLFRYLCIISCNAHEVSEVIKIANLENGSKTLEIGASLYPTISLINHSCDPNVVRFSYRDSVVVRAIQPISAGSQVFDNYGYHYAVHPLQTRQVHLCLQYHFKCECQACINDWPMYEEIPYENPTYLDSDIETVKKLEKSSRKFKRILREIIDDGANGKLAELCNHLEILHRYVKRPWREYNDCQEAIKQCLNFEANHYSEEVVTVITPAIVDTICSV